MKTNNEKLHDKMELMKRELSKIFYDWNTNRTFYYINI